MAPGKPRHAKKGRDYYVFNRPAPALGALPRSTEELLVAYRIFSPGLNELEQLDQIAATVRCAMDRGLAGELMKDLGVTSSYELQEISKKCYTAYAAEIKRMDDAEKAEIARLAEELVAREAAGQAQAERERVAEGLESDSNENRTAIEDQNTTTRQNDTHNNNINTRSADNPANDMIPDPYWLSKDDAQAALDATNIRAKALETTLLRLQDFYIDTFVTTGTTPSLNVTAALARLDIQLRQDAIWYVDELQRVMGGAASTELGFAAAGDGVWEWKRGRFGNAMVRGMIERVREFGARLVGTGRELEEADRLRGEFVRECEEGKVGEGAREMFLEEWATALIRVTETVAHEAREYVSFRSMEAEWAEKWAEKEESEDGEGSGSSVVVIDSSDSDDDSEEDSEEDDSENELEDGD